MFSLAAAGLVCGGSPSPALAQGNAEPPPRPTATPTPPVPKYRDILVAWLTDPNDRLGPVSASVALGTPNGTTVKYRMVPARDEWKLQHWAFESTSHKGRWMCQGLNSSVTYKFQEAIDASGGRGMVTTWNEPNNETRYVRGVVPKAEKSACDASMVSNPDGDMQAITRTLKLTFGIGSIWRTRTDPPGLLNINPPPSFDGPTLQTADDLLYQTPGGPWTTQMLVSIGAAAVVMIVLRSMIGLLIGIAVMPAAAFGMVTIGYGNYWYVMVVGLLFVFSAVAWGVVARRS